jgi:hypothetical protein
MAGEEAITPWSQGYKMDPAGFIGLAFIGEPLDPDPPGVNGANFDLLSHRALFKPLRFTTF